MQWTDEGIVLGTRRHGETSLILELMTEGHGRHLGLVRGGRSRRLQPMLQPGNTVRATWRARLDEHLGNYTVEATTLRAARLIESAVGLYGVQALASLIRLLPERDPHAQIFTALAGVLDWLDDPVVAGALIVRFELRMLEELGFGLDLERCAATGTNDDLAYVSPKTGRAVSRSAGEPYHDRLLVAAALPLRAAGGGGSRRGHRRLPPHRLFPGPPRLRAARADRIGRPVHFVALGGARRNARRGGAVISFARSLLRLAVDDNTGARNQFVILFRKLAAEKTLEVVDYRDHARPAVGPIGCCRPGRRARSLGLMQAMLQSVAVCRVKEDAGPRLGRLQSKRGPGGAP